eukprot:10440609-Heterocapsa_arctica.AAC.1
MEDWQTHLAQRGARGGCSAQIIWHGSDAELTAFWRLRDLLTLGAAQRTLTLTSATLELGRMYGTFLCTVLTTTSAQPFLHGAYPKTSGL